MQSKPKFHRNLSTFITFVILLYSLGCLAQNTKNSSSIINKKRTVSPKRDTLFMGTLYFSNPPFDLIKMETVYTTGYSQFLYMMDSLHPRSINATADNISYIIGDKRGTLEGFSKMRFSISKNYEKASGEYTVLQSMFFELGTITFSGVSFTNTVTCEARNYKEVRANLSKCSYGSIINLSNCSPKNSDGSIGLPINKTIRLL